MQFRIKLSHSAPALGAIEHSIREVDPAALVDIDKTGETLRVSATLGADHLLDILKKTGWPVAENDLERVPSECCGGCGG